MSQVIQIIGLLKECHGSCVIHTHTLITNRPRILMLAVPSLFSHDSNII